MSHHFAQRSTRVALVAAALFATALPNICSAVIMPNGVDAQFIRINKTKPNNLDGLFHVGEVRALSLGTDVAVGSLGASATSVHGAFVHGQPGALVTGVASSGGDTWTRDDEMTGPGVFEIEALVNLGQVRTIQEVQVLQRSDCCQERLYDFTITLEDASNTPVATSPLFAGQAPATTTYTLGTGSMILPGDVGVIGTETVGAARFVQVINNGGANRLLHIGELEVFQPGVSPAANFDNANDLALAGVGATIESASTEGGHGVTGAVIDGAEQIDAATWTKQQTGGGSHITVDLGGTFDVDRVRAHQRNDGCCQERLSNFSVNLYADDGTGNVGGLVGSISFPGQAATNSFAQVSFGGPQFTIGGADTLKIELDALLNTSDLLSVGTGGTGALTIAPGASLLVTNIGGTLMDDQTFDILDFGTITGQFSSISLPGNPVSHIWDLSNLYTTGQITLQIIPEPSTFLLLGLGLVGLAGFGRRRAK